MHEYYLQKIKSFEGFTAEAKWDYAQFTNGFGHVAIGDAGHISSRFSVFSHQFWRVRRSRVFSDN